MRSTIINFNPMQDKTETKMGVHQILTKNGFYRLPMHSLTEILKLLEMPESLQPKSIQENAINGILKLIQKHKQARQQLSSKFSEYIQASKAQGVSKETKDYVNVILQDSFNFLTKKSLYQLPPPPPHYPSQMPASMPGYPQMNQYSYMRPPVPMPGNTENDPETMKILDEQMRMQQQMYMYYYGMYGMNPMFNPGYMNPYGAYGQMPNGKSATGGSAPMPPMGMPMPMGPMGPMPPLGMPPLGPMPPGYPPKPLSRHEDSAQRIKETPVKETEPKVVEKKSKITDEGKAEKEKEKEKEKAVLKSEQKKRAEKAKLSLQNPPFVVSETAGNTRKVKEQKAPKPSIVNELLRYCACKGIQKYEQVFLCSICNRTFHYRCLNQSVKKSQGQGLECYHCRLRFIDPLNRVKEVIAEHYIPNISDNKFWMTCNLKPYEYLCRPKGGKNEIEMRCLKVSSGEANEITWPDECIIKLNGQRIIEIPALQINSSLKKRKDYSIIITQNIYNKGNQSDSQALEKVRLSLEIRTLTKEEISHRKIKNNFTFAFAIYFVQRLTVDELYQKVVAEERVPESPDYLQRLMRTTSKDIEIDKIVINLYDPFTWDVIHTPVRGSRCLHGQCFDLKTFISFMSTARNRTWKCPVCGKDARKFMVDSQQSQLIKRVQETNSVPSQITFMKDGTIVLKVDNHEEEDEHVSSSRPEKTKKIHKERQERPSRERESESRKEEADPEPRISPEKQEQPMQEERRPVPAPVTEIVQLDEDPQEEPPKQQ